MQDIYEFLAKGGVLMIPILLASLAALFVFFERLIALRRREVVPERSYRELLTLIGARRFDDAMRFAEQQSTPLTRVVDAAIRIRGRSRAVIKEVMEEVGGLEVAGLSKNLRIVSSVATIEPLLGLLGTVMGMIKVFQQVAVQKHPDITVLAQGIWEALITTGAGLTVGIPAFLAFRLLQGRVDRLGRDLEECSLQVLNLLTAEPEDAASTSPAGAVTPKASPEPAP
jgi:biopolymer transport protein ExbB